MPRTDFEAMFHSVRARAKLKELIIGDLKCCASLCPFLVASLTTRLGDTRILSFPHGTRCQVAVTVAEAGGAGRTDSEGAAADPMAWAEVLLRRALAYHFHALLHQEACRLVVSPGSLWWPLGMTPLPIANYSPFLCPTTASSASLPRNTSV